LYALHQDLVSEIRQIAINVCLIEDSCIHALQEPNAIKKLLNQRLTETNENGLPPRYVLERIDSPHHPVILYLHGGGYVAMSTDTHRVITNKIAKFTQGTVFAINYKLAPEYPFPYGLIDALYTYLWLITPRKDGGVGVNPSQLVIGGDSAGGGLSIATVLAILNGPVDASYRPETYLTGNTEDRNNDIAHRHMMSQISNLKQRLPLPCFVFALSPWVDLECKGKSWEENSQYCYLRKEPIISQWYAGHHKPLTKIPLDNPLISPVNGNFKNFPPLLIQVGAKETLFDDSLLLSEKAKASQVNVTFETYPEMSHVFHAFGKLAPFSTKAFNSISQHIKVRVGKHKSYLNLDPVKHSRL